MKELDELRLEINRADDALLQAFIQRMRISREIGACKREHGLPIWDEAREAQIIKRQSDAVPEDLQPYLPLLYKTLFKLSRDYQRDSAGEDVCDSDC